MQTCREGSVSDPLVSDRNLRFDEGAKTHQYSTAFGTSASAGSMTTLRTTSRVPMMVSSGGVVVGERWAMSPEEGRFKLSSREEEVCKGRQGVWVLWVFGFGWKVLIGRRAVGLV